MKKSLPDVLTMIRELVAQPTVSCVDERYDMSNQAVIDLLATWADSIGLHVTLHPTGIPGKTNIIARWGIEPDNEYDGLVLSGHTDTVPCHPESWSSDPFTATERDNRIYGLGTADMKSWFALVLHAISQCERKKLQRPLVLLGTADEESTLCGASALLASNKRLGKWAVIGEPTNLTPIRMHKGVLLESIIVYGKSGHSSDPSLGANAIEGMYQILRKLIAFRDELKTQYRNPLFHIDYTTLNFGAIHGGDNPNRICGACTLHIDIRPLPGMQLDTLHYMLSEQLASVFSDHPDLTLEVRRLSGLSPFIISADSEVVRLCETLTGKESGAVAFGTEAPFLSALGLETIVFGPGSIEQAHQPDEYLAIEQIPKGIQYITELIQHFCFRRKGE